VDLTTWPQPDWVTYATGAVLLVTTTVETVMHYRLSADLRVATSRLEDTTRLEILPEEAPRLTEEALTYLRHHQQRRAVFQRWQRRLFLPVTGVFLLLMGAQIFTTIGRV